MNIGLLCKGIIGKIKDNKFNTFVLIVLVLLFFVKITNRGDFSIDKNIFDGDENVIIFVQPSCHMCNELKEYVKTIDSEKYKFVLYDITQKKYSDLLFKYTAINKIPLSQIGTPFIVSKNDYQIGFNNTEEGHKEFIDFIERNNTVTKKERKTKIKLPIFGEIDLSKLSLPVLTIIMGLADGFNPCAMWVLVYLISITVTLKSKSKLVILVGTFVLSSGILYYLFMTAWLNVFLLVGFIYILSLIIGLVALYYGITSVYEFIKTRGYIQCKLSNNQTRQKSMNKIKELIGQKLSPIVLLSIIALAFVVNSIEFLCSAALPATYTYILTQAKLSFLAYYSYIFFYTVLYMLDDIIVFSFAVFAINKYAGDKYEKYSTLIGGSVMILIGILIIFFPQYLK